MQIQDLEDLLTEDPVIHSQQYAIISYILPDKTRNELDAPLLKFRGAYRSIDECKKKAEKLDQEDTRNGIKIPINMIATGMWGRLETDEELQKNKEVDIEYKNQQMNEMMKGYRQQQEKADIDFEERREYRRRQLAFDGTKEGQKYLSELKEHNLSIVDKISKTKEDILYQNDSLKYVMERIKYNEGIIESLKSLPEEHNLSLDSKLREGLLQEIDTEIDDIEKQKLKFEERLSVLNENKKNIDSFTIKSKIVENEQLVEFGKENKCMIEQKIVDLKKLVEEQEEILKARAETVPETFSNDELQNAYNQMHLKN
jgi:Family of unknown function (DUF5832)